MNRITKLVLPMAGLGKRLHPLTAKVPKALIKLRSRPLLNYILREAYETEIREVILVISPKQREYFIKYLKWARKKFPRFRFATRFQKKPLGTGHALLAAKALVRGESFAVRNCDDLLPGRKSFLGELIRAAERLRPETSLLTLRKVPKNQVSRFGVVTAKHLNAGGRLYKISGIVEKPKIEEAPSNLILIGAYIISPLIMKRLEKMDQHLKKGRVNDALPITDVFALELARGGRIYGLEFRGRYLDCGTLGGLKAAREYFKKA